MGAWGRLGDLNLFLENENKNPEAIFMAAFPPEKPVWCPPIAQAPAVTLQTSKAGGSVGDQVAALRFARVRVLFFCKYWPPLPALAGHWSCAACKNKAAVACGGRYRRMEPSLNSRVVLSRFGGGKSNHDVMPGSDPGEKKVIAAC